MILICVRTLSPPSSSWSSSFIYSCNICAIATAEWERERERANVQGREREYHKHDNKLLLSARIIILPVNLSKARDFMLCKARYGMDARPSEREKEKAN